MASPKTAGRTVAVSLVALGFLALPLAAQKPSPRMGLIAGVSFTNVSVGDEDDIDFKSRTSFMGGGFAEVPLSNTVSLQPELLYMEKGANLAAPESGSIKLTYFEIPLLLRVNIPTSGGGVRPHLYAGPAMGFKVACDVDFEGTKSSCDDADVTLKGTDLSAVFGGGIDIKNFTIGARYDLGLANISDTSDNSEGSAKNRALSIYLGFGIPLRK